mgnify:CR=1 FL=1
MRDQRKEQIKRYLYQELSKAIFEYLLGEDSYFWIPQNTTYEVSRITFSTLSSFLEFIKQLYNLDDALKKMTNIISIDPSKVKINKQVILSEKKKELLKIIFENSTQENLKNKFKIKAQTNFGFRSPPYTNTFSVDVYIYVSHDDIDQIDIEKIDDGGHYADRFKPYIKASLSFVFNKDLDDIEHISLDIEEFYIFKKVLQLVNYYLDYTHYKLSNYLSSRVFEGFINNFLREVFGATKQEIISRERDIEKLTAKEYIERFLKFLRKRDTGGLLKFALENIGETQIVQSYLKHNQLDENKVIFYPFSELDKIPYPVSFKPNLKGFLFAFYFQFFYDRGEINFNI